MSSNNYQLNVETHRYYNRYHFCTTNASYIPFSIFMYDIQFEIMFIYIIMHISHMGKKHAL